MWCVVEANVLKYITSVFIVSNSFDEKPKCYFLEWSDDTKSADKSAYCSGPNLVHSLLFTIVSWNLWHDIYTGCTGVYVLYDIPYLTILFEISICITFCARVRSWPWSIARERCCEKQLFPLLIATLRFNGTVIIMETSFIFKID